MAAVVHMYAALHECSHVGLNLTEDPAVINPNQIMHQDEQSLPPADN
jgi:hypothetical protein